MDDLTVFERRLAAGLEAQVGRRRPVDGLAIARVAAQRAETAGAARLPRAWRSFGAGRPLGLSPAFAVFVALALAGALVAGGVAVRLLNDGRRSDGLGPHPSGPIASVSPAPSSDAPAGPSFVYYNVYEERFVGQDGCTEANADRFGSCITERIWVANADGTDARELFPDDTGDRLAWALSPDGRRLVYSAWGEGVPSRSFVVGLAGGEPMPGEPTLVEGDEFDFSPDGTRLAFVRTVWTDPDDPYPDSVIAIVDLATGVVTELATTASQSPDGHDRLPKWSPDGTRLLFIRDEIGPPTAEDRIEDSQLFVIDVDGSDLRRLADADQAPSSAEWAPDGALIAFTSSPTFLKEDPLTGQAENVLVLSEVYTGRADGSDPRRLTEDTLLLADVPGPGRIGASTPTWTRDGEIAFLRTGWGDQGSGDVGLLAPELWVMAANGGSPRQLDLNDLAALNAAGCIRCPYPPTAAMAPRPAFWRSR
jgi:hypothetical protein